MAFANALSCFFSSGVMFSCSFDLSLWAFIRSLILSAKSVVCKISLFISVPQCGILSSNGVYKFKKLMCSCQFFLRKVFRNSDGSPFAKQMLLVGCNQYQRKHSNPLIVSQLSDFYTYTNLNNQWFFNYQINYNP
jgi:hypothetical protein